MYTLTKWLLKLPDGLLLLLSGQPQMTASGGRKMDPANQLVLATSLRQQTLFIDPSRSVPELREWWKQQLKPFAKPPLKSVQKRDMAMPVGEETIPIREYTPQDVDATSPALVYLHGGGFTAFEIDTYQGFCEHIAHTLGIKVYSVGYRLAPEHPYPTPLDDCCAAFAWVCRHADELGLDPSRISIGGDSAGGNMSAALCLKLRDAGAALPRAQLLIYPSTDLSSGFSTDHPNAFPSIDEFAEGQIITRAHLKWFGSQYVPDRAQMKEAYASPLLAEDHSGLPPAVVITAGFDPLRDEARAYADRLTEAGVSTQYKEFSSLGHGFVIADASAVVLEANNTICDLFQTIL